MQKAQKTEFILEQEQETLSYLASASGPANSMDVVSGIIRSVVLNDPVNLGYI